MQRRTVLPLAVAGGLLAVVLLWVSGILRPVQNGLIWMFLPVARTFSSIGYGIGSRFQPQPDITTVQEHAKDLEARLRSISVDYVNLRALQEENQSLRKLAGFLNTSGYDHVSARVIARSPDVREAIVLIDRGSKDGIETGMAVVAQDGVYVGKISELQEHVATVMLASDERSRVSASVAGQHELAGLVQGEGNGVAKLTLIPQSIGLKQNDIIVTAGTEEKVPANLAIGLVNDVQGKPTDPFKVASLQPMLDISDLDLVSVLRPAVLRPVGEPAL